uniref:Uncharacterized protein n=1 Tax=Mycena chlorophos TaxID=658473 RepID=A0ABQ0LUJ6_MYCCL|nr:predicted protein [Mycena chlorophos]
MLVKTKDDDSVTLRDAGRRSAFSLNPLADIAPAVERWAVFTIKGGVPPADETPEQAEEQVTSYRADVPRSLAISRRLLGESVVKLMTVYYHTFSTDLVEMGGKARLRKSFLKPAIAGLHAARSDDSETLSKHLVQTVNLFYGTAPIPGAVPATSSASSDILALAKKANRGFNNDLTARLLCPVSIEPTPQYCVLLSGSSYKLMAPRNIQALRDGGLQATHDQFPTFIYPPGAYKPEDIEHMLCEGPLVLAFGKHLMHGPSTVTKEAGAKSHRPGKSGLAGLTVIGPKQLAYLVTQLRFTLASHSWKQIDNGFNYYEFYENISSIVADTDNNTILAKFNHHVFGSGAVFNKRKAPSDDASPVVSDFARLQSARAAKRTRVPEPEAQITDAFTSINYMPVPGPGDDNYMGVPLEFTSSAFQVPVPFPSLG